MADRWNVGSPLPVVWLTILYIASCVTITFQSGVEVGLSTFSVTATIPVAIVQHRINRFHALATPAADGNTRFTVWNRVMIATFVLLAAVGLLQRF